MLLDDFASLTLPGIMTTVLENLFAVSRYRAMQVDRNSLGFHNATSLELKGFQAFGDGLPSPPKTSNKIPSARFSLSES